MMYLTFTLMPYASSEAGYLSYCCMTYRNSPGYPAMNPILPPGILAILQGNGMPTTADINSAVAQGAPAGIPSQTTLSYLGGEIGSFLSRLSIVPMSMAVGLHITQYGTGGSYHPQGESPYQGQIAITVLREDLAKLRGVPRTIEQTLVHESIHLIIEFCVVRRLGLTQDEKEALVDAVCSCDELQHLVGAPYPRQPDYIAALPSNWLDLMPWKAGSNPTWSKPIVGAGRTIPTS